uniref:ARAD1C25190p n=1 Tax=Blastobotrys adeninivorans TaxID=409370 RepID=A0A060T200_BLAAD
MSTHECRVTTVMEAPSPAPDNSKTTSNNNGNATPTTTSTIPGGQAPAATTTTTTTTTTPVEGGNENDTASVEQSGDQTVTKVTTTEPAGSNGNNSNNQPATNSVKVTSVAEVIHRDRSRSPRRSSRSPSADSKATEPLKDYGSPAPDQETRPRKRRRRVPISCNVCRYRKLKCDRQMPCSSCKQLRMTAVCRYESKTAADMLPEASLSFNNIHDTPSQTPLYSPSITATSGAANNTMFTQQQSSTSNSSSADAALQERLAIVEAQLKDIQRQQNNYSNSSVYNSHPNNASTTTMTNNVSANMAPEQLMHISTTFKPVLLYNGIENPISYWTSKSYQAHTARSTAFESEIRHLTASLIQDHANVNAHSDRPPHLLDAFHHINNPMAPRDTKWNVLFDFLPSAKVCQALLRVFHDRINVFFHCCNIQWLSHTVTEVNTLYLARHLKESDHSEFTLSTNQVHKLCLVLLMCQMARESLESSANSCEETKRMLKALIPEEELVIPFLGDDLYLFAMSAVVQTDFNTEASVPLLLLSYYLCVFVNILSKRKPSPLLLDYVLHTAYAMGIHRDLNNVDVRGSAPSSVPRSMYLQMWRQVVILDTLMAALHEGPLNIDMRFAEAPLDPDVASDLDERNGVHIERALTNLAKLYRSAYIQVGLSPAQTVDKSVFDSLIRQIDEFTVFVKDGADEGCAFASHNMIQLLLGQLRLQLYQMNDSMPLSDIIAAADIQLRNYIRCKDVDQRYSLTILSSLGLKASRHAARIVARTISVDDESVSGKSFTELADMLVQSYYLTVDALSLRQLRHLWRSHVVPFYAALACLRTRFAEHKRDQLKVGDLPPPPPLDNSDEPLAFQISI